MPSGTVTPAGGGASGAAGGDLAGTYPNPTVDLNTGGGTMAGPVTIDVGALATAGGLEITGSSGANVKRLGVDFLHQLLSLTGDGVLTISSDDFMYVTIQGTSDSGAQLEVIDQPTGYKAETVVGSTFASVTASNPLSTSVSSISSLTGVTTGLTSAPPDLNVVAGTASLWFDATNGASKLMVKGKSADGTVVTASIALA